MKKFIYYSPYIPVVGFIVGIWNRRGENETIILKSAGHFITTMIIQAVSMSAILIGIIELGS